MDFLASRFSLPAPRKRVSRAQTSTVAPKGWTIQRTVFPNGSIGELLVRIPETEPAQPEIEEQEDFTYSRGARLPKSFNEDYDFSQ